jgi:uncharacterized protein (UPF0548 family)
MPARLLKAHGCRVRRLPLLHVLSLSLLWIVFGITICDCAASSSVSADVHAFKLTRSKIHRFQRHCQRVKLQRQRAARRRKSTCRGTFVSLNSPTAQQVSKWFWGSSSLVPPFNHNQAGMTNPCLQVTSDSTLTTFTPPLERTTATIATTIPVVAVSRTTSATKSVPVSDNINNNWWPSYPHHLEKNWRTLLFRKTVGYGLNCYQQARDRALQWEFQSTVNGKKGIVAVPSSSAATTTTFGPLENPNVDQVWTRAGTRLVTCARFCNSLWVVNPVSVVYEYANQRGPHPDTLLFSSTAYATLQGHWLRGEERVTVALRTSGRVDVEILSVSRPAKSVMGFVVWPFIRTMQTAFFQHQLQFLTTPTTQSSIRAAHDGNKGTFQI